MTFWNLNSISHTLGATLAETFPCATGISIDSRTLQSNQIFLAIQGTTFNAHNFLQQATDNGASALIISSQHTKTLPNIPTIRVPNTLLALHQLAQSYRQSLPHARVVAITGSNGKTTTCRLTHAALNDPQHTVIPRDSFNNHIGVPLTILNAPENSRTIICELGTSSPGEIALLSKLIQPDIAAITSVGHAHIQGFSSLQNIIKEKSSITAGLQPNGTLLIPHSLATHLFNDPRAQTIGLQPAATHTYTITNSTHNSTTFHLDHLDQLTIPIPGTHNACNAAIAAIIAHLLNTPADSIRQGLASASLPPMRLTHHQLGPYTLINDAYNANPESTLASINTFAQLTPDAPRRILILADMLELGSHSKIAHQNIGNAVATNTTIDMLITVGTASADARPSTHFNTLNDETINTILSLLKPGDAILLKGSRSMHLEHIEQALRKSTQKPSISIRQKPITKTKSHAL